MNPLQRLATSQPMRVMITVCIALYKVTEKESESMMQFCDEACYCARIPQAVWSE